QKHPHRPQRTPRRRTHPRSAHPQLARQESRQRSARRHQRHPRCHRFPDGVIMPEKMDGIDYTPAGIDALREDVIVYRDRAIDAFPEGIQMALTLSHAIALLAYLRDLMKESEVVSHAQH